MEEYSNLSSDDELHITTGVYTSILEIAQEIRKLFTDIGKEVEVIPSEKKE